MMKAYTILRPIQSRSVGKEYDTETHFHIWKSKAKCEQYFSTMDENYQKICEIVEVNITFNIKKETT